MTKQNSSNVMSMLRAIANGQSALREEMLNRFNKLDKRIDDFERNVDERFIRVEARLDKIGKSVAYLEDDTPTREEHDNLEKRVTKIEKKLTLA